MLTSCLCTPAISIPINVNPLRAQSCAKRLSPPYALTGCLCNPVLRSHMLVNPWLVQSYAITVKDSYDFIIQIIYNAIRTYIHAYYGFPEWPGSALSHGLCISWLSRNWLAERYRMVPAYDSLDLLKDAVLYRRLYIYIHL